MLTLVISLLVALAIAITIVLYLRRPKSLHEPQPQPQPQSQASWAQAVGDEFRELSEAERCDLIFAVATLADGKSESLLVRALDDPSEAVALAAAHALVRHGGATSLERYLAARPGERANALRFLVEILD
jgi:hypothetical protein